LDNASGINNKILKKKDTTIDLKDTIPLKSDSSNNKFDFLKEGNFKTNHEKSMNKSNDNFNENKNNFNNNSIDENYNTLKLINRNNFYLEDNLKFESNNKQEDKSYDKKLEFNYNYKKEAKIKNYLTDNKEESSTKFNSLSELKNKNFDRKISLRDDDSERLQNKFSKKDNYISADNSNLIHKVSHKYSKNFEDDKRYNKENDDNIHLDNYREVSKYNYDISDNKIHKSEIKDIDTFKNKYEKDLNLKGNRDKDTSYISKNYDILSEDSNHREKRDNSYRKDNNYNNKYFKYESLNREKKEAIDRQPPKPKWYDSSHNSIRDGECNIEEKFKFKSLVKKNETTQSDDLLEENRRLLNLNTSLTLKCKNLENELNNYFEKFKKLESEMEISNEKLSEMENHYLSIIKEKDETISSLNSNITQLEKEDVKNINIKIALFKNLKLFLLNNLKFLKISEEIKKEYQ